MFKHYLEKIHTENEDFLNKIGYDEETGYIPSRIFTNNIDTNLFYFESVRNGDLESVKLLIYSGAIDVNYRIRFNTIRRTDSDMIALREAIRLYNLDVAQFLLDVGHTKDFTVTFLKENNNNLFYESQKKAKQFCIDNNIDYKEE